MALNKKVAKGIKTRQGNELRENNKLIAEFMEYPDLGTKGDFSYLNYHTSWDWLMPVVEKINNTGRFEVNIGYGHCYISDGEDKLTLSLQGKSTFIKWYNKNKED